MAVRDILLYSKHHASLREKSKAVGRINQKTIRLIRDLKETLEASTDGIGLAAPQINIHKRVLIACPGTLVDGTWQAGPPVVFINPLILEASDEKKDYDGCLSFPGIYGETTRPYHLRVTGIDEHEEAFDRVYDGFNAVMIHHEMDHLEGVLFIDRIENPQDLYTLRENENGEIVRAQVSLNSL